MWERMRRFRLLGAVGVAAIVVGAAAGAIAANVALLDAGDDDAPIGRLSPLGPLSERDEEPAPAPPPAPTTGGQPPGAPDHEEPDGDEDEDGEEPPGDDD